VLEYNVKNLKHKVNFCSSSLNQKHKCCDKNEPPEIVKIGEAIGVGVGLSLDLVSKVVTQGLLGAYCRSLAAAAAGVSSSSSLLLQQPVRQLTVCSCWLISYLRVTGSLCCGRSK